MKNSLLLLSLTLLLAACSSENLDEKFEEKSKRVEDLEEELHTLEVENKQLKDDFDNIEEEIARINRDKKDSNIDDYQGVVKKYARSTEQELERLTLEINSYKKDEKISGGKISDIESNMTDIIKEYNDDVDELKLQDTLTRQHNKIEIFNSNLLKELKSLKEAIDEDDDKKIKDSINNIKDLNKYL